MTTARCRDAFHGDAVVMYVRRARDAALSTAPPRRAPLREAPAESINKTIGYIHMFFKSTNAIIYFVLSTRGETRRTDGRTSRRRPRVPAPCDTQPLVCFYKAKQRGARRRLASRRVAPCRAVPWPRAAYNLLAQSPRLAHTKVHTAEQKKRENRYRIIKHVALVRFRSVAGETRARHSLGFFAHSIAAPRDDEDEDAPSSSGPMKTSRRAGAQIHASFSFPSFFLLFEMGTAARDLAPRDRQTDYRPMVFHCRICAANIAADNDGVHIFAEDGRRHYLQTKIRKYLYILVSSEDRFSKMVCSVCIKRLEGVHRFAMMAYRTQEKLRSQLYGNIDNTNLVQDEEIQNIKDTQDITKKVEERGLLHSILTKSGIEILTEDEPLGPPELNFQEDKCHTPNMEEMEVKVDPMLFLQCGMEQSASETSDFSDNEEKVIRTDSPEPLPLTKKNTEAKTEEEKKRNENETKLHEDNERTVSDTAKSHECTICTRSFISQIGLQNHLWSHLPREKRFDGKSILRSQHVYSTNGVLHTNGDNNTSSNFICPICSKNISTKGNLKVHLETHRPKGKYGCDICGRIFKTQSNLFRHKEYHGGVQFPCNVCGRVYPTNSTLRAHSITHSDLRPHACPLCDKTFKRNQDLKFHINQHTGARPYQCPYCPKAFASSGNCFSHRKRMHPREVHRDRQRAADLMR